MNLFLYLRPKYLRGQPFDEVEQLILPNYDRQAVWISDGPSCVYLLNDIKYIDTSGTQIIHRLTEEDKLILTLKSIVIDLQVPLLKISSTYSIADLNRVLNLTDIVTENVVSAYIRMNRK